jgi:hypothetical protein
MKEMLADTIIAVEDYMYKKGSKGGRCKYFCSLFRTPKIINDYQKTFYQESFSFETLSVLVKDA